MADQKISGLTALVGSTVSLDADVLAIVDTSTTTTKKILVQELLNSAGNLAALAASTVSLDGDSVLIFDASAVATRRILVQNLVAATSAMQRKNAIINGDFNVWQRGTSFTSAATATYSADRWQYAKVGAMVHDMSRSADVPTVAEAGRLFNYSLLIDCTTVDAAIAAGDYSLIQEKVEGYNFLPLAQKIITLSFWVKATKTGIYCIALGNSVADRSCIKEYTINTTDTWEKKTLTFPASPSAGTWDYTTGVGLAVYFTLAAGSTWQTTADAYQTGNFFATANQVNATDDTANNFRLCGVQLEAGSVATEFEQRTFNEELALCQRYYWKSFAYGTAPAQNVGADTGEIVFICTAVGAAINASATYIFPTLMRAAPTMTFYNPAAANGNVRELSLGADCGVPSVYRNSDKGIVILVTGNAGSSVSNAFGVHEQAVAEL
jgi:hypothetical protein